MAKREKRVKRVKAGSAAGFILPSLFGVALFFLVPFIGVFYYAFVDSPVNGRFAGFENFTLLFQNRAFLNAASNTLLFSAVSVPLVMVLSLALAMLLNTRIYARSFLRAAFLSPMVIPVASVVLMWVILFNFTGSLNVMLHSFGYAPIDWMKSEWARFVIILVFTWKNAGYNMVIFLAALQGVPKELYEAARVDGIAWHRQFGRITLPYLLPTGFFILIMSLINSFKVFRETYLVTGDYPHESVYMLQHYMNNMFKQLDYQKLSAAAIVMAVVIALIVLVLLRVERRASA